MRLHNRLTISVIVTSYNRPEYLKIAIGSVLAQSFPIHEIIIVDDCSTKNTKEVAEYYDTAIIKYIKNDKNFGASYSRNIGIKSAEGQYIAFLDDDDLFLKHKIAYQIKQIQKMNCIGVLCGFNIIDNLTYNIKKASTGFLKDNILKQGNLFCGVSGLLIQNLKNKNLLFDESLSIAEDWDYYIRLSKIGSVYYDKIPLYAYRVGEHFSMTSRRKQLVLCDISYRTRAAYKHQVWLGEKLFKLRLANEILAYIGSRDNRCRFIYYAISVAGIAATIQVLAQRFIRKIGVPFMCLGDSCHCKFNKND